MRRTRRLAENFFHNWAYEEGITTRQVGGAKTHLESTHLGWWPLNRKTITNIEILPKWWGVQAPHQVLYSKFSKLGRWAPRTWLWKSLGALFSRAEGYRKPTLHSYRTCTKSHILQVPAQRKYFEWSQGQTHLLILESLQEMQDVTGTSPEDAHAGSSYFWNLVLPW